MSDIKKLVRRQRQKFNFEKSKASLPDAQIIRMPFNADFREKLSSGALDNDINSALGNAGVSAEDIKGMLGRNKSGFDTGESEAKIIPFKPRGK